MTSKHSNPTEAQALAEAVAEAMWSRDRAANALGIRIESVGPGVSHLSMPVRGERQWRRGSKCTSAGGWMRMLPSRALVLAAAQMARPSWSRMRKAIRPPPSARLMPIQSQPRAPSGKISLDHS